MIVHNYCTCPIQLGFLWRLASEAKLLYRKKTSNIQARLFKPQLLNKWINSSNIQIYLFLNLNTRLRTVSLKITTKKTSLNIPSFFQKKNDHSITFDATEQFNVAATIIAFTVNAKAHTSSKRNVRRWVWLYYR